MQPQRKTRWERFVSLFSHRRRSALVDALTRYAIRVGGLFIIAAVLAVFAVLLGESWPLFKKPRLKPMPAQVLNRTVPLSSIPAGGAVFGPYGRHLLILTVDAQYSVINLTTQHIVFRGKLPCPSSDAFPPDDQIQRIHHDPWSDTLLILTRSGKLMTLIPQWEWSYSSTDRRTLSGFSFDVRSWETHLSDSEHLVKMDWDPSEDDPHLGVALFIWPHRLIWVQRTRETSLFGEGEVSETQVAFPIPPGTTLTTGVLAERYIAVGTTSGQLLIFPTPTPLSNLPPTPQILRAADEKIAITALELLTGKTSLVVGDARGHITVWFPIPTPDRAFRLKKIRTFPTMTGGITAIVPDRQTRAFLTLSDTGELGWHHSTAEKTRFRRRLFPDAVPIEALLSGDRHLILVRLHNRRWHAFQFKDPYPEASFTAFFKKIWYEGYDGPRYIWQSSSGHDSFEPKFSLVPLIYGTLKGTFYALFFAIPLALLSALYMGQFMDPNVRAYLKPVIELMAGLPSVVLGFIGGLWLAPRVEHWFTAFLLVPIVTLFALLTVHPAWSLIPKKPHNQMTRDILRMVFLAIWVLFWIGLTFHANAALESVLFGGDYQAWFYKHFGWTYEQRNALVVGFVMGYAVIPIIFSIAEDAIVAVPRDWIAGAIALGATRWQTLTNIVIPAALSGIVSAVMVGFGRAIGETMIVLMATGNTPVMNMIPFTGFRTLSANLAVELPEAPVGETHYRILFFSALLLFFFTIVINTAAEILRERIRRQYYRK